MNKGMWANHYRWIVYNELRGTWGGQASKRKPWFVVVPDGHMKPGRRFRTQPEAFRWALKQAMRCKCEGCAKGMRSMWSDRGLKRAKQANS